jgi:hypothetical protein
MRVKEFEVPEENDNPFVICDSFLISPEGAYSIGNDWKLKFRKALDTMFEAIDKLEKDEDLCEEFSYSIVEECLNFLIHMPKEKSETESFVEFVKAFSFLAYNLNNNLDSNEVVNEKIAYIDRYYNNALTYVEMLKLAAVVNKRVAKWREWFPPSFRLSGHYYNLIKGE